MTPIVWPRHKAGLHVTHNQHLNWHDTIEEYVTDRDLRDDFQDPKEMIPRCIETGHVWQIQWYPDTPVGSYSVAAPTFEEALSYALEIDAGLK